MKKVGFNPPFLLQILGKVGKTLQGLSLPAHLSSFCRSSFSSGQPFWNPLMSYTFTYIWGWRKVWKSGGGTSAMYLFAFLFYSCKIWRGHGPLWPHFSATPDLHTYTLQKTAPPFSNALTQYNEILVVLAINFMQKHEIFTYSWNIKWQNCAGMGLSGFIF